MRLDLQYKRAGMSVRCDQSPQMSCTDLTIAGRTRRDTSGIFAISSPEPTRRQGHLDGPIAHDELVEISS